MGFYKFGVPQDLVAKLKAFAGINVFVETGTFTGGTSRWAAELFETVYTIEINPELRAKAMDLSKDYDNIHFLLGNSKEVLPENLTNFGDKAIFWLDGHYSGGITGGESDQCPVMEELKCLTKVKEPYILIDDARCFLGRPPKPLNSEDWPQIDEVFKFLDENFPTHRFTIHDDVIICVPEEAWEVVLEDWDEKYQERFPAVKQEKKKIWEFF